MGSWLGLKEEGVSGRTEKRSWGCAPRFRPTYALANVGHPSDFARPFLDGEYSLFESLVPKKGLEPPHPCEYMDLNHARLPIPPLRHKTSSAIGWIGSNR
jgi:hypothetical protein